MTVRRGSTNPYLNNPPTELARMIKKEKDQKKKKQMERALWAWRTTVPGPFGLLRNLEGSADVSIVDSVFNYWIVRS